MEVRTVYNFYEATLIESKKVEAPAIYPQDFVYLLNKSVKQYLNRRYALFDTSQQTTDDINPLEVSLSTISTTIPLPEDYWHLTSCIVTLAPSKYYANQLVVCGKDPVKYITKVGAKKLTTDAAAMVSSNAYLKPTMRQPYYKFEQSSVVVDMGTMDKNMIISAIKLTYLKKPQIYTVDDMDIAGKGVNSTPMEFATYVNNEIVNTFMAIYLEENMDPRLQTNIPVNQSIADSGAQQPQQQRRR